jgi:hypothetical protein
MSDHDSLLIVYEEVGKLLDSGINLLDCAIHLLDSDLQPE